MHAFIPVHCQIFFLSWVDCIFKVLRNIGRKNKICYNIKVAYKALQNGMIFQYCYHWYPLQKEEKNQNKKLLYDLNKIHILKVTWWLKKVILFL